MLHANRVDSEVVVVLMVVNDIGIAVGLTLSDSKEVPVGRSSTPITECEATLKSISLRAHLVVRVMTTCFRGRVSVSVYVKINPTPSGSKAIQFTSILVHAASDGWYNGNGSCNDRWCQL
jgi:hypothetical protein